MTHVAVTRVEKVHQYALCAECAWWSYAYEPANGQVWRSPVPAMARAHAAETGHEVAVHTETRRFYRRSAEPARVPSLDAGK